MDSICFIVTYLAREVSLRNGGLFFENKNKASLCPPLVAVATDRQQAASGYRPLRGFSLVAVFVKLSAMLAEMDLAIANSKNIFNICKCI